MAELERERQRLVTAWHTSFKKGADFDLWGQPVEATAEYHSLSSKIKQHSEPEASLFADDQKKVLNKITACLELRAKALQRPGKIEGISLEDLKKVEQSLRNLLTTNSSDFPLEVSAVHVLKSPPHMADQSPTSSHTNSLQSDAVVSRLSDDEREEDPLDEKSKGNLLPPPAPVPGKTMITVRIEKIGLKEASQYIDPFITVSIKDLNGQNVTAIQDTPIASVREEPYIFFGTDVFVQKPLEFLPQGFAVFFEFKHYKPKKKIVSTKCWALMEKDEIKEGSVIIELYKKPTDFRRKKINLLTVKPLYLHLKITLN